MLARRFYYALKPYLPKALRMTLRRLRARRQRRASTAIWPIDPAAGTPPPGWTGWPDGKSFALVLTHDVEGQAGVDECRRLAELESELGFRSSFNFIPEGGYPVPSELRSWLTVEGFEVGVHDLEHDGRLYSSERIFRQKAERINRYLREWHACGFRSGFMLRNLDWLHHLEIEYDCSTFDTDPFEPQPEAAGTIFPFWVGPNPGPDGRRASALTTRAGYVELPYTLPQDSTLFLLHEEPTNAIWRQKLDWIAQRGGMALLNVHPDYLGCTTGTNGPRAVSVADHYRELLTYVKTRYAGAYWHVLPRELATFVRRSWRNSAMTTAPFPG